MGKTLVVVGTQWGDEGKGKVTNYFSSHADVVVRYCGGDNAGHTVVFGGKTFKLHTVPCGIFNPQCMNVLGNGMVINPRHLHEEIKELQGEGYDCRNLFISDRANVLFDWHIIEDGLSEKALGANAIGTTKKGIGPAYTDKAARRGIRMVDFVGPHFKDLFLAKLAEKNTEFKEAGAEELDPLKELSDYQALADEFRPFVTDTVTLLNDALVQGKNILCEGAQATLLDVDFGTYPFVTSSNTSVAGVASGTGMAPQSITDCIGVVKAYTTRVGAGTMPTELFDETGSYIRETGHEYGVTTHRPRRIGWFDGVVVNYSRMINGLTGISVMLLDVLTGIKTLKIATGYLLDGKLIKTIPASTLDFDRCTPVYEEVPGWTEDITHVTSFSALPANAQAYLKALERATGVPVVMFSVGPDKEQTIVLKTLF